MPRIAKIAEVGLILVLVAGTAWLGQMMHHNYVTHGQASRINGPLTAPVDIPGRTLTGEPSALDVSGRPRPLMLFVLSTACPFCEQNMPEWRSLASQIAELGPRAPEIYVLSVSTPDETQEFLATHELDLPVRLVDKAVLPLLGLTAYPSTLGIDPLTRGIAAWDGVLNDADQEVVRTWARSAMTAPVVSSVALTTDASLDRP